MKRLAVKVVSAAMATALVAGAGQSAPKPSPIPIKWELDIRVEPIKAIEVRLPGSDNPQLFWFIRYTLVNDTGQDILFVPDFVLYTDNGQILRAGQQVPTAVFKAVKQLYNDPLMKDMTAMTGKLLQGEDNAKEGVAIWRDFDPKAGGFDIFIGGLSGESAEIKLPTTIKVVELAADGEEKTVETDTAIITKTLDLQYGVPGEAAARNHATPKLLDRRWVMR